MKLIAENGFVRLCGVSDFDPEKTFECGQCFRWEKSPDGAYTGVAFGRAARVWTENGDVCVTGTLTDFDSVWRSYFDLDSDYGRARRALSADKRLKNACDFGAGIRILRQEPWEALGSFILSQCNNIPRIRGILSRLCALFGDPIRFKGEMLYSFPMADRLAALSEKDLAPLRSGYRAPYLLSAARAVASGKLDFGALSGMDTGSAECKLISLDGVGKKVAHCVLLYGLHRTDAFPVDVWMRRALSSLGGDFDPDSLGANAGIAQQYLFHYIRNGGEAPV